MTKPRPLWSKWRLRVAAIACGLLLLNGSSAVWAAGKKASAKPAAARHAKKSPLPSTRRVAPVFGQADLIDENEPGLRGHASFYGHGFQGRKTATGEIFDVRLFTAASNRFPLGTMLAVRRVDNDRCAIVKVNDRMHPRHRKRIIDVSRGVAEYLNMIRAGVIMVHVAPLRGARVGRGNESCQAAFDPVPPCLSCGQPEKPPEIESRDGG